MPIKDHRSLMMRQRIFRFLIIWGLNNHINNVVITSDNNLMFTFFLMWMFSVIQTQQSDTAVVKGWGEAWKLIRCSRCTCCFGVSFK